MLSELLSWAREKWPGVQLDLGFPTEDREVCEAAVASGFKLLETSEVYALRFDGYVSRAAAAGLSICTGALRAMMQRCFAERMR